MAAPARLAPLLRHAGIRPVSDLRNRHHTDCRIGTGGKTGKLRSDKGVTCAGLRGVRIGTAKLRRAFMVKCEMLDPERALSVAHCTDRIDRQQRPDTHMIVEHGAGAAEPALELTGLCAKTGSTIAQRKFRRARVKSLFAKPAIGRRVTPIFCAAIANIKKNGRRHNWRGNRWCAHGKPAPFSAQFSCNSRSRIKAVNRPAGQTNSVHPVNQIAGLQSICFARAGPAPGTAQPATQGASGTTTLTPVIAAASSALPTKMPSRSDIRLAGPGVSFAKSRSLSLIQRS